MPCYALVYVRALQNTVVREVQGGNQLCVVTMPPLQYALYCSDVVEPGSLVHALWRATCPLCASVAVGMQPLPNVDWRAS